MKIILSKNFIHDFNKDFQKYGIYHGDLIEKLKETPIIHLKNPFFKIKTTIKGISIRGIGVYNDVGSLIPIFIVLKKDKKYGENMILDKELTEKINHLFSKYTDDFETGNIETF